jgi:ATP/maltotriose-dependent transcriptional regulator MalT
MACDAASSLWLMGRTDHIDVIEDSLRHKVLIRDFCYPLRDTRLSIAHMCALQGRYEKAAQWFAKAREVLDEAGWRPLRAIVDYDESLTYLRRGTAGDESQAQRLLDAALQQFRTLGMPGWIRRAEDSRARIK